MSRDDPDDKALIVVPAWNEEQAVGATIAEIYQAMPHVDVLVVDDGSTDRTAAVAAAAGARVLELSYNLGVGGAMRAGFRYAVQHGYYAVVQVDADGQHNPTDLPAILGGLADADMVIGSRFAGAGDYRIRGPRHWAMVLMSKVISGLARTKLTDTTSGFRATGPRALPLFAEHYPVEYLGDTIESLVIAVRAGCRIAEVPASMRPRQAGRPSHRPIKAALYLFRAAFALVLALVRRWDVTVQSTTAPLVSEVKGGLAG